MQLYDYQADLEQRILGEWDNGHQNVMATMATGGGKTVVFCHTAQRLDVPTRFIAHRQELISQISLTLNEHQIEHTFTLPQQTIREIVHSHIDLHGKSYYRVRSHFRIESIDTLVKRAGEKQDAQVGLVVGDEGHHFLATNKWGRGVSRYSNARGLYFTAHAHRADGLGLGRVGGAGIIDVLVVGPCGRDLMRRGFLTDYRVHCPDADVDLQKVEISDATGDYNQVQLRNEIHKSRLLVGSCVEHYLQLAAGKLGFQFAADIEEAGKLQRAYRAAGVPTEVITADTDTKVRRVLMQRFRARQILMLVSVDVLGEGVDVPAVEVVIFGRPTASWQLYCQQKGRVDRVMVAPEIRKHWGQYTDQQRLALIAASEKPRGIVIDPVGNFAKFTLLRGLPCSKQTYNLASVPRASLRKPKPDAIPYRTCLNKDPLCLLAYEAYLSKCPYCGFARPAPVGRNIDSVAGNLLELDPAQLDITLQEIRRIDGAPNAQGHDMVARAIRNNHAARQDAQRPLREMIALWAGWHRDQQLSDEEIYRKFWYQFGTDVATAMTFKTSEAYMLYARLIDQLQHVRST